MKFNSLFSEYSHSCGIDDDLPDAGYETRKYCHANSNWLSPGEFIFDNVFWALIAMIWYRSILFRSLDGRTMNTSLFVLWAVVLASVTIGILVQMKDHRNSRNVVCNVVLGYGLYTALSYIHIRPVLIQMAAITVSVLIIVLFIVLSVLKWKRKWIFWLDPISKGLAVQKIIVSGLAIVIAVIGAPRVVGFLKPFFPSAQKAVEENYTEQTIDENLETLAVLGGKAWEALPAEEKLTVLQKVADIERSYLGLPHRLYVGAGDMGELSGYYNDSTHEIMIDRDHLLNDPSWDLVNTVCHEAYHAYEHRLVDALYHIDCEYEGLKVFRDVDQYAKEFAQYKNGEEDLESYYSQRCESDARKYARDAEWNYRLKIEDYLQPEEEDYYFQMPSLEDLLPEETAAPD